MVKAAAKKAAKKRVKAKGEPVAEGMELILRSDLTREERRLHRPEGCRNYMRNRLAKEFGGIVSGFVEAAKTGSVPHLKLATELLKPVREGTKRKKSSAARFLDEL